MTKSEFLKFLKERVTAKMGVDYSDCYYEGDCPDAELELYLDGEFVASTHDYLGICEWSERKILK